MKHRKPDDGPEMYNLGGLSKEILLRSAERRNFPGTDERYYVARWEQVDGLASYDLLSSAYSGPYTLIGRKIISSLITTYSFGSGDTPEIIYENDAVDAEQKDVRPTASPDVLFDTVQHILMSSGHVSDSLPITHERSDVNEITQWHEARLSVMNLIGPSLRIPSNENGHRHEDYFSEHNSRLSVSQEIAVGLLDEFRQASTLQERMVVSMRFNELSKDTMYSTTSSLEFFIHLQSALGEYALKQDAVVGKKSEKTD